MLLKLKRFGCHYFSEFGMSGICFLRLLIGGFCFYPRWGLYIYIYRERERDYVCICIYIYICIYRPSARERRPKDQISVKNNLTAKFIISISIIMTFIIISSSSSSSSSRNSSSSSSSSLTSAENNLTTKLT